MRKASHLTDTKINTRRKEWGGSRDSAGRRTIHKSHFKLLELRDTIEKVFGNYKYDNSNEKFGRRVRR